MAAPQKDSGLIPPTLVSLFPALLAFSSFLKRAHVKGMIIGGIAAGLLGKARTTVDIDATIWADDEDLNRLINEAGRPLLTAGYPLVSL